MKLFIDGVVQDVPAVQTDHPGFAFYQDHTGRVVATSTAIPEEVQTPDQKRIADLEAQLAAAQAPPPPPSADEN